MAPATTAKKPKAAAAKPMAKRPERTSEEGVVDRAAELSDDVLKSVEKGQRAAIDAVRKFTETVDEALPTIGGRPTAREKVVDAALEMADKLVTAQYDFLRTVVKSADRSLTSDDAKKK